MAEVAKETATAATGSVVETFIAQITRPLKVCQLGISKLVC